MNWGSCFKTLMIVAVVHVTFDRMLCIDNFRSMTFSKGVTPIASPNVTLYTLNSFHGISRIDCFSKCSDIPSSCVGVCLNKSNTIGLCGLLTFELTGEPLGVGSMETASIAIWKRDVCGNGFHFFGGHCYGVGEFKLTWNDAEGECEQIGAYLAEVDNTDENIWLTTTFVYPDVEPSDCPDVWSCSMWIGAGRNNDLIFVWSRYGNQLTFQPWYPGEPGNRTCVNLLQSGQWDDDYCHVQRMYICEKEVSLG